MVQVTVELLIGVNMEKHYAFIKDSILVNVSVFSSQDKELADRIVTEQGYDEAIWTGEDLPVVGSTWDGTKFIEPKVVNEDPII